MSLRARLTLLSVVVMGLIVGIVSGLDLAREISTQFESTLERAEYFKRAAVDVVRRNLNRDLTLSFQDAVLKDPDLPGQLLDIMAGTKSSLLEISVCDTSGNILASSDPSRTLQQFGQYKDFRPLVEGRFVDKLRVLWGDPQNYQLYQALAASGDRAPVLYVRVVVYTGLIRKDITPTLLSHAEISAALLGGAIVAAFLFSTIAYRPLGKLGRMLDLLASGQFEFPEAVPAPASSEDEFHVVASKVSLLGQQLRGAQYQVSDLRGNFERLMAELEDAVLIFGRDRRLVVAAGAVRKFLGRDRDDLLGKSLAEVFPPSTSVGLLLEEAAGSGRAIRNLRVPMPRDNAGDPFQALLSVETGDGLGSGAALMVRLRDPEATRQLGRQLQTANRLEAIGRITAGVAHEVKNPLNAILTHVELARLKLAQGSTDLAPQMDIIASEIVRLDRVVKTFLDFNRPVALHLVEVPLESFVAEIVSLARPLAEAAGIEVSVEQRTEGASIRVDRDLLKQAILNIVMNAVEAMPAGGRLRFESAVMGENAEIRIADSGPGIPQALREKIFRLYFTTKEKGSGIGLAMTFRIVQLHDGTIDFASEPGKGATFVISLAKAAAAS
ncbi:MAG: PAS domain-containing protein [Candidatus Solibacter usitatus]|nr:PAS domain-containing protein [Candidatus Solibacter usitatus]